MTPEIIIRSFTNDQYVIDKVFYANYYKIRGFQEGGFRPLVVDVGAHCGYFSFAALSLGARKVIAFEPFIENYKILLKNLERSLAPALTYQLGVYTSDSNLSLAYPKLQKESYFDFTNLEIDNAAEKICVAKCLSLDSLLTDFVGEEVDILKLSIGYAEIDILKASQKLASVKNVCGEIEITESEHPTFRTMMQTKGYVDVQVFPPLEEESSRSLFIASRTKCDELFKIS